MSPSSTVHGGQHNYKGVTSELLLHAAFVADEIWGYMLEPACTGTGNYYLSGYRLHRVYVARRTPSPTMIPEWVAFGPRAFVPCMI